MVDKIIVFTDGSSTVFKNEKKLRYGGIGIYFQNVNDEENNLEISKAYIGEDVTNQRMELSACIDAIKICIDKRKDIAKQWKLIIYTDSTYTINCATKWAKKWILFNWKRKSGSNLKDNICNLDLIKELYTLACMYPITFEHIRGHQKEPDKNNMENWYTWYGNKCADKLAVKAMLSVKE